MMDYSRINYKDQWDLPTRRKYPGTVSFELAVNLRLHLKRTKRFISQFKC